MNPRRPRHHVTAAAAAAAAPVVERARDGIIRNGRKNAV